MCGTLAGSAGIFPGLLIPVLVCVAGCCLSLFKRPWVYTQALSIFLCFLGMGCLLWNVRHLEGQGDALSRYVKKNPDTEFVLEGKIRRSGLVLAETAYTQFFIDVDKASVGGESLPLAGGVVVRWNVPDRQLHSTERVRVSGKLNYSLSHLNPGTQDVEDYLRRKGIHTALNVRGADAVELVARGSRISPLFWASHVRAFEARRLSKSVPDSALPFILAVWLGERNTLDDSEYQTYVQTGTAHILAVSGVHVGIVFIAATFILRLSVPSRRTRAWATMALVIIFALSAGARISIMRAGLMVVIYLIGDLFDRDPDVPTSLSIAGMIFVLINPEVLFDKGFQLSFLSLSSILIFAERIDRRLEALPGGLRQGLSTSIAVQIVPLPVAVDTFHVLPLISPLTNLLIVPLLGAVLCTCLITTIASSIWLDLGVVFGHALVPQVWLIQKIASIAAQIKGSFLTIVSPTFLAMVLYWLSTALLAFGGSIKLRLRWRSVAAAMMMILTILFWKPWNPKPEIVFLDVGHGDSAFIRTPRGQTVLIDGGDASGYSNRGKRLVAPFLWSNGVTYIDRIFVSHAHSDHIGGLSYIVEKFDVGEVVLGPFPEKKNEPEFIDLCRKEGIPVRRSSYGDVFNMGGTRFEVLHPSKDFESAEDDFNERSLVLRITWQDIKILFAGDVEKDAEKRISKLDCKAEILKVPHHASDTSSSPGFVQAVQPQFGVVSASGFTRHRGLDEIVLKRYEDYGIKVLRTDILGGIRVLKTDDGQLTLSGARQVRGYL